MKFWGKRRCWRKYSHRAICHELVLCLLLFGSLAPLNAQDNPSEKDTKTLQELNRSLAIDIESARHDELLAWCRVLDLAEDGDDEVLRARLRNYYGISAEPDEKDEAIRTKIVVESAHKGEYLKIEVDNFDVETVVRLSGGVVITADTESRQHRIEADQVIFNQAQGTVSAQGNIAYNVVINGKEEKYSGDKILFRISEWSGITFRGTAERIQQIDDEAVNFLFRGESIRQPKEGILIFNDGGITSDSNPNPHYMLKAKKMWVTGPSEWSFLSATLYVGHVPVFYFPFYWKSENSLFFNPTIGNRSRAGYYIQTSTYLIGEKQPKREFSIMGFGVSDNSDYELTRDGLFLIRKAGGSKISKKNTLKYMLDVYTSLGAMTGFSGDFATNKTSISFYSTIAVSRSINSDGNIHFRDNGEVKTYWNSSQIGDTIIPFRWGNYLDFKIDNWSLFLNWYSDPFYLKDFDNRKENFDWISYLLGEEGTDIKEADLVTDLKWEIRGSGKIEPAKRSLWFEGFVLDHFATSLSWRNKANQELIEFDHPDKDYNPLRSFYYPHILILPDLSFSLSGSSPTWSLDWPNRREAPDHRAEKVAAENAEEMLGMKSVPFRGSIDSIYSSDLLRASINYDIRTQFYVEHESDSSDWSSPSDIDFDFEAAKINAFPRGQLSYNFDLGNGLSGFDGTTSLSGLYQTHLDMLGKKSRASDEIRLADLRYSKFLWDNGIGLYFKPFQSFPTLKTSSLNYDVDATLYAYKFASGATLANPSYSGHWLSDKEDFRENQASMAIIWELKPFSASFVNRADIPPLDQRYSIDFAVGFDYEGWELDISQQTLQVSNQWDPQPLIMKASWKGWKNEAEISQSARYDIDHNRISETESFFRFWGFETIFVANHGINYTWNKRDLIWEKRGESFAPRHLRFLFHRDFEPAPIWKNRIRLQTIIDTSWNINLSQPTDNVLEFKWTQVFHTYKFIDIKFAFTASNKSMYIYFPWWREQFGISGKLNFFEDLFKSFNVFKAKDRYESNFNMERLDLTLVHHLGSWDLTIQYGGWPAYDQLKGNYRWKSDFELFIKWQPLPMFNQRTNYKDDKLSVDSFEY